jgi:polysaccharide deacetylase family protein (PEP-CTERM system associated)
MNNILSVDVEDYFQVEALASSISYAQWDSYELRVESNVALILELFAKYDVTATFFVLGWIAKKLPHLCRRIAGAGHEIGCHGYAHTRLHKLTANEFRADIRDAVSLLADQVQRPILCYRAPSFSIVHSTMWALDVLVEEGFEIDSSVFPVRHDVYGVPDAPRFPHWQITPAGNRIFEFPPSSYRYRGLTWGLGGGYLRFLPYGVTHWMLRHINKVESQPAMIYFHPWEIDPGQPVVRAGLRSTIRHYTNLSTMEGKIERLLQNFRFVSIANARANFPPYADDAVFAPDADRYESVPRFVERVTA